MGVLEGAGGSAPGRGWEPSASPSDQPAADGRPVALRRPIVDGLRIGDSVAAVAARLATDLPGSALVGPVFHRLDDEQDFNSYRIALSLLTSIAWSLPESVDHYPRPRARARAHARVHAPSPPRAQPRYG